MPSEEMLKKLLDEFVEKEIFIKEELAAVTDQIAELESRLNVCRQRLSTISGDRDKVLVIKGRYLNGDFVSQRQPVAAAPAPAAKKDAPSAPAPVAPAATIPPAPVPPPAPTSGSSPRQTRSGIAAILGNRSIHAERPGPSGPANGVPPVEQTQVPTEALPVPQELQDVQTNRFDSYPAPNDPNAGQTAPAQPLLNDEDPDIRELGQSIVDLGSSDEQGEEGESDTIKNINDALRSLFR